LELLKQALVYRKNEHDDYYKIEVCDDQMYRVGLRYEEEWETLIDWTGSPVIIPGAVNTLGVLAEGRRFDFFINGRFVGSTEDERLSSGQLAVAIYADEDDKATIEFDNFIVRVP
jgi:hypothetical protein